MKRLAALLACLFSITACSKTDLLNAIIPRDGYDVHRDIAYGTDTRQMLDIYVPAQADHAPVIVFFYGGSWQYGSKDDYRFLGQALASKGFVTVVADYRLYPQVHFPAFVEDGAKAFTYVHNTIAQYGGDPEKLFIAGHSAGAYIAMMVSVDGHYITAAGGDPRWIKGSIGIAGPYDFLPFTDPNIKALFSTAPDAVTQPINHLTHAIAPVMLAHGTTDDIVDPRNSHRMKAKLESLHSPVIEHLYPDTGHIGIMLSIANGFRSRTPLLEEIAEFVSTTLAKKSAQ